MDNEAHVSSISTLINIGKPLGGLPALQERHDCFRVNKERFCLFTWQTMIILCLFISVLLDCGIPQRKYCYVLHHLLLLCHKMDNGLTDSIDCVKTTQTCHILKCFNMKDKPCKY